MQCLKRGPSVHNAGNGSPLTDCSFTLDTRPRAITIDISEGVVATTKTGDLAGQWSLTRIEIRPNRLRHGAGCVHEPVNTHWIIDLAVRADGSQVRREAVSESPSAT